MMNALMNSVSMLTRIAGASLVVLAASVSHASLVTNGSFESGLTGWTCVAPPDGCITGTQSDIAAFDGLVYFFGRDNEAPAGLLSQNLATDPGTTYDISLHFYTEGLVPPNALSLNVGDLTETLGLIQGSWASFTGIFTASGATTALELFFVTNPGSSTVFVDQVTVDPVVTGRVPEPGTVALLGLGLVGLAAARRRRR